MIVLLPLIVTPTVYTCDSMTVELQGFCSFGKEITWLYVESGHSRTQLKHSELYGMHTDPLNISLLNPLQVTDSLSGQVSY